MDITLLYWHWLAFGMLLMMFEIALPSFTVLWFGLGAVLVGCILWFVPGLELNWQVFIWAVSSAAFTWFWFRWFKPRAVDKTMAGLSREAIVGEIGHVISVPQDHRRGRLRFSLPILGAEEWDIICEQSIKLGDRVVVTDVSGNALVVQLA